ncbi:hypothetical protein AAG570_013037 [Ranatra chinensis]|uniref:Glucosidase 2 subunit beta n=1 Tax=Ranatra chinensis TaxID=642074 RepID=A0ABD0YFM3_9HEMI
MITESSLYQFENGEFTCFDGTLTLPTSYVNDDYCDCFDGSDEPGTSACPNGIFHCGNDGYVSKNIPSSRVNDGICDCCDATDEYATGNCSNTCAVLSAEAKLQAEKLAELMLQGNHLRLQMITAGKQLKMERKERISALEIEKAEAEQLKSEAETVKNTAEASENSALEYYRAIEEAQKAEREEIEKQEARNEAKEAFKHLDSDSDGILKKDELITRNILDKNKDGEVSDEELQFFMDDREEVSEEDFFEVMWPKLKPFYMMQQEATLDDVDNDNNKETEGEEDWDKSGELEVGKEEEEPEADEKPEDFEPPSSKYDEQTQKLIDEANKARANFEAVERSVRDLERELSKLKESVSKDYGVDDEFISLDGQCFTYTDREYTYKLCPFDQVVQMGKSGGSETRLGVWKSWGTPGDYNIMLYEKGQSCWNGPQRSTKVLVSCGLESVVVGASEPNKCEYVLEFKTPAACKMPQQAKDNHDEL